MDNLKPLWDLYEAMMASSKQKQAETSAPIGSPNEGNFDHPVIQKRAQMDRLRAAGMKATDAHEKVHGEVNLSDVTRKADMASSLGRIQNDGGRNNVNPDDDEAQSVYARDLELEKMAKGNPETLKTKVPLEVGEPVAEAVELSEEFDYNNDVAYLQKYGRA